MEKNPILVLFDLSGNFAEGKDDCRGVRLGQGGMLEGVRTEGMLEDIGGPCQESQEKPQRVGQEAGGRRAVAVEVILHRLDSLFAVTTRTIEVFVEPLGRGRLKRGHHKAGVSPALITSALSTIRQGCAQAPAA